MNAIWFNSAFLVILLAHYQVGKSKANSVSVFSEREIRYMLSPVRLSVVCLSVVCNVRAPYSGGSNFRQYFYGVRYRGHPLTSTENFTEIVPGEPLHGRS